MAPEYQGVRLTTPAYDALQRRKREDESFSETVERLARERPIADLAGTLTEAEVAAIRTGRDERDDRRTVASARQ